MISIAKPFPFLELAEVALCMCCARNIPPPPRSRRKCKPPAGHLDYLPNLRRSNRVASRRTSRFSSRFMRFRCAG